MGFFTAGETETRSERQQRLRQPRLLSTDDFAMVEAIQPVTPPLAECDRVLREEAKAGFPSDGAIRDWSNAVLRDLGKPEPALDDLSIYIEQVLGDEILRRHARRILDELSDAACTQRTATFALEARYKLAEVGDGVDPATVSLRSLGASVHDAIQLLCGPPPDNDTVYHLYWSGDSDNRKKLLFELTGADNALGFMMGLAAWTKPLLLVFLPPADPQSTEDKPDAHTIGQLIGAATAAAATPQEIVHIAQAIIYAVHADRCTPQSADPQVRFGYRLGTFLREMGSSMVKVGQYGHSLPILKAEWMPGLAGLKHRGSRDTRANKWRTIDATCPEHLRTAIWLGRSCGDGSYLSTNEIRLPEDFRSLYHYPDDSRLAITLLKPGARKEALSWLNLFIKIADQISRRSPQAETSVRPLRALLTDGKKVVEVETDLEFSSAQERVIEKNCNSVAVLVGGLPFKHISQGLFDAAEFFRTTRLVEGKAFNDFPASTMVERMVRRYYALADLVVFIFLLLAGRPINHDQHGGNELDGAFCIGHIDPGAQRVEPVNVAERRDMVNFLIDVALYAKRNRFRIDQALRHCLNRAETAGATADVAAPNLDYLRMVMRALLAKGDSARALDVRCDIRELLLAVLATRSLDTVMTKTLLKRIVSVGMLALSKRFPLWFLGVFSWTKQEALRAQTWYPLVRDPSEVTPRRKREHTGNASKCDPPLRVPVKLTVNSGNWNWPSAVLYALASIARRFV